MTSSSSSSPPPSSPEVPSFDQTTYLGRLQRILHVIDPRTLAPKFFFGLSLEEAVKIVQNPQLASSPYEYWLASKIKDSAIHPDSGEKIPMPFRLASRISPPSLRQD
jgi:hypothetical protein